MPDEIQSFFIEGYYETDIQRTIDHTFSVYTTDGCLLSTDDVFFPIDVRLPPTPPTPDVWSWFNSFNCDDDVIANEEVTLGLLLPDLQDVSGFDFEFSYDNTDVNPLSGNPFVSDWFDITYTIDDNAGIISGTAIRKDPLSKLDIGIFSGSDADVVIGNNVMQIKFVVNPGFQINSCTFAGVSNIDLSVLNSGATEIFTRTTGFGDHICLSGNSCSCTGTTPPENIQTHFWQFMGNDVTYLGTNGFFTFYIDEEGNIFKTNDQVPVDLQGVSNQGVVFTASENDKLTLPSTSFDFSNSSFTLEAWVNSSNINQGTIKNILTNNGQGGSVTSSNGFLLGLNENNIPFFTYKGNYLDGSTPLAYNDCQHIAVTIKAERLEDVVTIYVDGNIVAIQAFPHSNNSLSIQTNENIQVGGVSDAISTGTIGQSFEGLIKEVRIWSRSKSETGINLTKDNQLLSDQSGLVAYWKMNETGEQLIIDHSGNSYHGFKGEDSSVEAIDPQNGVACGPVDCQFGVTFYIDKDEDTFGDAGLVGEACGIPDGFVVQVGDCDDNNASINPTAQELCDGVDNDCDGSIDEIQACNLSANGLYFDGDDDQVSIPLPQTLTLGQTEWTFEVILNIESGRVPGENSNVFGIKGNNIRNELLVQPQLDGSNELRFGGGFSTNVPSDECIHFAFSNPGIGTNGGLFPGVYNTFINGQISGIGRIPFVGSYDSLFIGRGAQTSTFHENFKGLIKEVRIWNVRRTPAQLNEFQDKPLTGNEVGLVGYWKLNEGTNQLVEDLSSNQNNGFLGTDATVESSDPTPQVACGGILCEEQNFYRDADGDGFGNPSMIISSCTPITGYVSNFDDCNDNEANAFPGAVEICDGIDNNCDGQIDEGFALEIDGMLDLCSVKNGVTPFTILNPRLGANYTWSYTDGTGGWIQPNGTSATVFTYSPYQGGTLTVTDNGGCNIAQATLELVPSVSDQSCCSGLTGDIQNSNVCQGQTGNFWFIGSWEFNEFEWTVNDDITSTTNQMNFIFLQPGTYDVKLNTSVNGSCQATIEGSVEIGADAIINGLNEICIDQDGVTYSVPNDVGGNFQWLGYGHLDNIISTGNTATVDFGEYWTSGAPVVVQYTDNNGCFRESQLPVTVNQCIPPVKESINIGQWITVYPNPFTNSLNVSINSDLTEPVEVLLINQSGQELVHKITNEQTITFEEDLEKGIYTIKIIQGSNVFIEKVYKSN